MLCLSVWSDRRIKCSVLRYALCCISASAPHTSLGPRACRSIWMNACLIVKPPTNHMTHVEWTYRQDEISGILLHLNATIRNKRFTTCHAKRENRNAVQEPYKIENKMQCHSNSKVRKCVLMISIGLSQMSTFTIALYVGGRVEHWIVIVRRTCTAEDCWIVICTHPSSLKLQSHYLTFNELIPIWGSVISVILYRMSRMHWPL